LKCSSCIVKFDWNSLFLTVCVYSNSTPKFQLTSYPLGRTPPDTKKLECLHLWIFSSIGIIAEFSGIKKVGEPSKYFTSPIAHVSLLKSRYKNSVLAKTNNVSLGINLSSLDNNFYWYSSIYYLSLIVIS